ncbi:MAG: SusD/RagB family nutrient-binding outer membrane lipoprotein [Cyclobacteriaceae bacterium]|nr:SusD/RagB family nutrient-binding outer membrane lipoprotein [Cyclobacteriaceae bacterium]
MKLKHKSYFSGLLFYIMIFSCESGFDELNTNKVEPISLNPVFLFNQSVIEGTHDGNTITYEMAIVQQIVTPFPGVLAGGNHNVDNRSINFANWRRHYRNVIKHAMDVKRFTENDAARSNLYHMARIWYAYSIMIVTDTYGDVPSSEAGLGFITGNVAPRYDTQQEIYNFILNELDQAAAALDPGRRIETGEILFGGDIVKWRKFAYSLMLRAAMRLSKADTNKAREYASKAFAGGVMSSNSDNAVINHDFNFASPIGNTLNATEANNFYLTAPFVNFLKENIDPRLASIAVRYVGASSGPDQNNTIAGNPPAGVSLSKMPADQIGMPMGYDNATIGPVVTSLNLKSIYEFSQVDRTRMAKRDAPMFLVTYAQTQFLLAEAASRGWITANAAALFESGIRGHMAQLSAYGSNTAVPQADIDDYIAQNPLVTETALEQINTQYWVASFLNGPEAFANFRRSGFPALVPNPYPGKDISGNFIRRLTYPDDEKSVNPSNLNVAIDRQGPDNMDTRVYWDKP